MWTSLNSYRSKVLKSCRYKIACGIKIEKNYTEKYARLQEFKAGATADAGVSRYVCSSTFLVPGSPFAVSVCCSLLKTKTVHESASKTCVTKGVFSPNT